MTGKFRDMAREVGRPGWFGSAGQRGQRRKSPWNLILIPLVLGCVAATTYILFRVMWEIHVAIYPLHAGRLSEFWVKRSSFGSLVSSFLLLAPLLFAALPVGMLLANVIAWLIPPARRTFDREAIGVAGSSFAESMSKLRRAALTLLPICLVLSSIGAATLREMR